ncbi:unnamed protein product [Cyprideis torosa]|uniref:Phosducin domain-containing protein n=1 Tax=Cyprideis torosa TaxID=163714 RepID=A0A7R8W4A2_9CRUS|nr:unnamed protein product [Cyprideis torosa]CAG0879375.1 unnamed protein product [Cyprideis torosa]
MAGERVLLVNPPGFALTGWNFFGKSCNHHCYGVRAADGVPALLIYKGGQLLGNFIRLRDEFGEDFFATDVETFLVSHGFLNDEKLVPPSVGTSGVVDDPSDKRDSEDEDAD